MTLYIEYQQCNQNVWICKFLSLALQLCTRLTEGRIKFQNIEQLDSDFDLKIKSIEINWMTFMPVRLFLRLPH